MQDIVDVLVVGAGNAASCAALSAREHGASVVMLEAAPEQWRGGNTAFAGGQMRVAYNSTAELLQIIDGVSEADLESTDFGTYSEAEFFDQMASISNYACDAELVEFAVKNSFETLRWLRSNGIKFQASFGRQSAVVGARTIFWGGLPCIVWGGGAGLIEALHRSIASNDVSILYDTPAVQLLQDGDGVTGVRAKHAGRLIEMRAKSVVLACGGFEASPEMRARYLGPNWDLAKVRGTPFNTGLGLRMALDCGARAYGHWSCAHSSFWDLNAPNYGDTIVGGAYQKHSYPFGILVNARGERFLDEGEDFQTLTYAKYGREILKQPGLFAWQIFDQRSIPLLRDTYRIRQITKASADTLEALAQKLEGVDAEGLLRTIRDFNRAVPGDAGTPNPAVKDGVATVGLAIPKSNWARPIDCGPFEAYAVTAGITFTFGGLKITTAGEVEDDGGRPIPGLYSAGEMIGGLFYHNYPSGTGLTCGAVFGRAAGRSAAAFARARH
jgi:tricarballylate dehydrogenase